MLGFIIRVIIGFCKTFFKLFIRVCKATGGWFFFSYIVLMSAFFTDFFVTGFSQTCKNLIRWANSGVITGAWFYGGLVIMIAISFRNIVRHVTGNQELKLRDIIFKGVHKVDTLKGDSSRLKTKIEAVSGVFFGKVGNNYVTKKETEDGHVLVIGGAGSGKSSCIAIPSLITWQDRIFAIDIKGELAEKSGRAAAIFNPCANSDYGYDPYYLLHESENKVQDAREIALCLIPMPADIKDPFWITSAQNLLTGCILHCHNLGLSFIETLEAIQITPVAIILDEIFQGSCTEAKMFVNQLIGLKSETLSGIFTELSNNIMVFATDPQLKKALSNPKAINPTLLERGEDVFLQIPEHKLEQWRGLLSLIVQQFLKHFERRPDGTATPVLFLLDEFARLGKIEVISNGLATLRSKKVHICILTQSLAQIDAIYGKVQRQVIADNCSYKAILRATDAETQEYFSKLVGTYDKQKVTQSANYEQYTKLGKGTSKSITTEEKRIIKPEEFAYLQDIVLLSPFGFARIEKAPYYQDKYFVKKRSVQ